MAEMKSSLRKTLKSLKQITPIVLGVIMLVAFLITAVPQHFYTAIFTGNNLLDPLVGGVVGSISTGNPMVSYILGGELVENGVSLVAVTAFLVTWVTVGIVQLPAEFLILGKKFAFIRNGISFCTAMIIAVLIVFTLTLI